MSICHHQEYKGSKMCPRCYPNHGVGGVHHPNEFKGEKFFTKESLSRQRHPFKKNVSGKDVRIMVLNWHYKHFEERGFEPKVYKGLRFY